MEYAAWWNKNGVLCLQIETVQRVSNARQLAKPGVDCLTWRPADLSFDLEAHPAFPFQTSDDCVRHALKQLEGTGIKVSFRNATRTSGTSTRKWALQCSWSGPFPSHPTKQEPPFRVLDAFLLTAGEKMSRWPELLA